MTGLPPRTRPEPIEGYCASCGEETTRKCSLCQKDFFCSESCQDDMPMRHKFECRGDKPLTSADGLLLCVEEDVIPVNDQVIQDFGFSRIPEKDWGKLIGLYKGLTMLNVSSEQLHRWQVERSLEENIVKAFSVQHEDRRGQYFPWFLRNKHCLFDPAPEPPPESYPKDWFDIAKPHLDKADRVSDPDDLVPVAKRDAFYFFTTTLHFYHPTPSDPLWYKFGFCTCKGSFDEFNLGGLYQRLIVGRRAQSYMTLPEPAKKPCTFDEFWKAYDSGKLIQLMDEKGLKTERQEFPYLEKFLSVRPGGQRPSVWALKQFLADGDTVDSNDSMFDDYGFRNCQNVADLKDLMRVYQNILQIANPLELHQACVEGNLYEFCKIYNVRLDSKFQRLMRR